MRGCQIKCKQYFACVPESKTSSGWSHCFIVQTFLPSCLHLLMLLILTQEKQAFYNLWLLDKKSGLFRHCPACLNRMKSFKYVNLTIWSWFDNQQIIALLHCCVITLLCYYTAVQLEWVCVSVFTLMTMKPVLRTYLLPQLSFPILRSLPSPSPVADVFTPSAPGENKSRSIAPPEWILHWQAPPLAAIAPATAHANLPSARDTPTLWVWLAHTRQTAASLKCYWLEVLGHSTIG